MLGSGAEGDPRIIHIQEVLVSPYYHNRSDYKRIPRALIGAKWSENQ